MLTSTTLLSAVWFQTSHCGIHETHAHIAAPPRWRHMPCLCVLFLPDLCLEALQYKVCPATEATTFHDAFLQAQDIIVNALDNVEARRYVDRY